MNNYLTCQEIEELAQSMGISIDGMSLNTIEFVFRKPFFDCVFKERNKMPLHGIFHNKGNQKAFIQYVIDKMGSERVCTKKWLSGSIRLIVDDSITLYVYEDKIEAKFGLDKLHVGLHSKFYDEVFHFLLDDEGGFRTLFLKRNHFVESMEHYISLFNKEMKSSKMFQQALCERDKYESLKAHYEEMYAELSSFSHRIELQTWDEGLMKYAVEESIKNIEAIKEKAKSKTPEACAKMEKKYTLAQDVIRGANERGLTNDSSYLKPWAEFINDIAGNNNDESLRQDYIDSVRKIFDNTIAECNDRGTSYMKRKVKKMVADIELCKKLKSSYGADCFIDRSMHSQRVSHLNVILDENQVIVFRIDNVTPTEKECVPYIRIAKALDCIHAMTGLSMKAERYSPWNKAKFNVHYDAEFKEKNSDLINTLKFAKGSALDINQRYVTMIVQMGNMGLRLPFNKPEAKEKILHNIDALEELVKSTRAVKDLDIKGIYHQRQPYL